MIRDKEFQFYKITTIKVMMHRWKEMLVITHDDDFSDRLQVARYNIIWTNLHHSYKNLIKGAICTHTLKVDYKKF